MSQKPRLTTDQINEWLANRYDGAAAELAPISGGFWSAAYTYRIGEEHFVLRFSDMREGFVSDTAAMHFASPDLPIPEVIEIGEALDHHYAISRRHYGRFVEDVSVEDADAAGAAMAQLLVALRSAPPTSNSPRLWHDPNGDMTLTWRDFLHNDLIDNPDSFMSGWRKKLAQNREVEAIFMACKARIEELLPICPERHDLVHRDLLHQNVLISEDATCVTAIFSWKCSVLGDFLYDTAWCTFWGAWHPGIAAADLWQRTINAPDLSESDLIDAPLRHHCYELQIAASHFGWNVWTGDDEGLVRLAAETELVLNRGALPIAQ